MKIKTESGDVSVKTEQGVLEIGDGEEGIVISPENRINTVMEICILRKGEKNYIKGNIMWIKLVKEKK